MKTLRGCSLLALTGAMVANMTCCSQPKSDTEDRLAMLDTTRITIGEHAFEVWVAKNDAQRQRGLMQVTATQMAPVSDDVDRGMLFLFPEDQPEYHGFWMKDTIIPLDIAFIRRDGSIVSLRTMAPLDLRTTNPSGPYRFALEINANRFKKLGIRESDTVEIPESVLNNVE